MEALEVAKVAWTPEGEVRKQSGSWAAPRSSRSGGRGLLVRSPARRGGGGDEPTVWGASVTSQGAASKWDAE